MSAPGCVLYARVPLAPTSASWWAQSGYVAQPPDVRVACASAGPCAPASGVVVVEHGGTIATSATAVASASATGEVVVVESGVGGGGASGVGVGTGVGAGVGVGSGTGGSVGTGGSGGDSAAADVGSHAAAGSASGVGVGGASGVGVAGGNGELPGGTLASASAAGAVVVTGRGRGLLALAGEGVTIDGSIAALDLLTPLAGGSFDASARVGGDASFTCDATLAHDALPSRGGSTSIVVRVAGGARPSRVPPLRVHLVIDASTSMQSTWGDLQDAALRLVARMRPDDELQIVVYSTDAREVLAPLRVGDGANARRVIRALRPEGRTHIESGLRVAYRAIRPHASIVVVLSDGVPNGGLSTPDELGGLAAQASARGAITTAIGIGWDFHPGILRAIAEHGHGHFRIAPRVDELGAILEGELAARGLVTAHDVEVAVALGAGVRAGELPAGVVRTEGGVRIALPSIAAGEEQIIVVPVEVPPGTDARSVARVGATWTPLATGIAQHADETLSIAVAPTPVLAGGALAALDADLAGALVAAADAITHGDATAAAGALRDHAARATVHLRVRAHGELDARTAHVLTLATALERLVPSASWHDRRAMGASMLAFTARF